MTNPWNFVYDKRRYHLCFGISYFLWHEKLFHAIGWNYYGGFWCGVLTLLCGLLNDEQSVITARHDFTIICVTML